MNSTTRFFKESTNTVVPEGSLGGVREQFLKQCGNHKTMLFLVKKRG